LPLWDALAYAGIGTKRCTAADPCFFLSRPSCSGFLCGRFLARSRVLTADTPALSKSNWRSSSIALTGKHQKAVLERDFEPQQNREGFCNTSAIHRGA